MTHEQKLLDADNSIKTHGRSFFWATVFLPRETKSEIQALYRFLRAVDDVVDSQEMSSEEKLSFLKTIEVSMDRENSGHPVIDDFRRFFTGSKLPKEVFMDFLKGMNTDIGTVRLKTDNDLLLYAYRVAGVVGTMMCAVLKVENPRYADHAIQLGIAMQLTNVARDVCEDAQRHRVYLPDERVPHETVLAYYSGGEEKYANAIMRAVRDLLELAESYYERGIAGLVGVPWRARFGILLAARLYRAIGRKIKKVGNASLRTRVFVSGPEKVLHVAMTVVEFVLLFVVKKKPNHPRKLKSARTLASWIIE